MVLLVVSGCITKNVIKTVECGWYEPIYPHLTHKEIDILNINAINTIKHNDKEYEKCP